MKKKGMMFFLMVSTCIIIAQQTKSQSVVHGIIKDVDGKLLQFANVFLLSLTDSSLINGTVSDTLGKYSFENVEPGKYFVSATSAEMDIVFSQIFEITPDKKEINPGVLYLKNAKTKIE